MIHKPGIVHTNTTDSLKLTVIDLTSPCLLHRFRRLRYQGAEVPFYGP